MTVDTEKVMQTLFALAQTVNTPTTPFKIMSRRFRHFKDVPSELQPAFFQMQRLPRETDGGERSLPKRKMFVWWLVYLPGSPDLNTPCSPLMNRYYDALSNALLTNLPRGPQGLSNNTLGGLVTRCYEDGRGYFDEGLLTTPSLIAIPITITTGI